MSAKDNKKWTDSDLQTAYEDGCKFPNLTDLKDFLLKRGDLIVSTESKCNKQIVSGSNLYTTNQVKALIQECCGEVYCEDGTLKGKSPAELYEWIENKKL